MSLEQEFFGRNKKFEANAPAAVGNRAVRRQAGRASDPSACLLAPLSKSEVNT